MDLHINVACRLSFLYSYSYAPLWVSVSPPVDWHEDVIESIALVPNSSLNGIRICPS